LICVGFVCVVVFNDFYTCECAIYFSK